MQLWRIGTLIPAWWIILGNVFLCCRCQARGKHCAGADDQKKCLQTTLLAIPVHRDELPSIRNDERRYTARMQRRSSYLVWQSEMLNLTKPGSDFFISGRARAESTG